jgi:hypothetical protein
MSSVYFALVYLGLFSALVGLLLLLRARARQDRAPFPDNTRLLRAPGESLQRRLDEIDERLLDVSLLALGLPAVAYGAQLYLAAQLRATHPLAAGLLVWLGLAGLLTAFYLGSRRLLALIERRRNTRLGLFGERIVAEHLETLKTAGHRVFHDLPAEKHADGNVATIDHVVVGPAGVFAIETKTRRKGRARVGFMAHEIIFDGEALAYPWGEDRHGLAQAHRQAEWLARHLADQTGIAAPIFAFLVFPGWSIIRKGRGPVHALSPRELPAAVTAPPVAPVGLPGHPLDAAKIERIASALEARCRDVEL